MSKRALVSGITGQDGSYLAEFLLSMDYEVTGLDRRKSVPNSRNIAHILDRIKIIVGDITDPASVNALVSKKFDEIYLLAAQSFVGTSFDQPYYTFQANAVGVLNFLEAVRVHSHESKIYFSGSSEQYGGVTCPPSGYNEYSPFYPRSPYGVSKLAAFWLVKNYREAYGLKCCSGILFNHESVPKHTPVVIMKEGLIDVIPIEDMFMLNESHRYEGIRDFYKGADVWDGQKWTEILDGHCYKDPDKLIRCVQTVAGCYEATYDHITFKDDGSEIKTSELNIGDRIFTVQYPPSVNRLIHDLDLVKAIGYIVGDGHVSESGRIRLTGIDRGELEGIARIFSYRFGWGYRISTWGPGHYKGCRKNVWQLDFFGEPASGMSSWGKWLRQQIYTVISGEKRIPQFILNSEVAVKQAFFDGYYLADGRKHGGGKFKYKGWTTSSATLCLGLLIIVKEILKQEVRVGLDYRDKKRYYYCTLATPNPDMRGAHLRKPKDMVRNIYDTESDGLFFDLTTVTKRFAVGPNLIQIHNSPRRGHEFVTQKICTWVKSVCRRLIDGDIFETVLKNIGTLRLGNIGTFRDWGHAIDMVRGMWMILNQKEEPLRDIVLGTGEVHTVREFIEIAVRESLHRDIVWKTGFDGLPIGEDKQTGLLMIECVKEFYRPAEVDFLKADSRLALNLIGWKPEISFQDLVKEMIS